MKISGILSTKNQDLITILPAQTIQEAIVLLTRYNIGALLVVNEGGDLVGILSERDIIRRAVRDEASLFGLPVQQVMTPEVITGVPQDDIISVANTMTERRFRHLPITDHGRLVGIISIGDVLKAQRDQYRGEIDTLETQILADDKLKGAI